MVSSHKSSRRKIGMFQRLADGRIKVTVRGGTSYNGNSRRIYGYADSEEEAERLALELAAQLNMRPDLGKGLTLERWWQAYSVGKGKRLTNATFERYRCDMEGLWLPALGKRDISLIAKADVQALLLTLPTRSRATHAKAALSAVLTQAVQDGYLTVNVMKSGSFELPGDVGVHIDEAWGDDPFSVIEGMSEVWDARTVLRVMPILAGTSVEPCWLAMVGAGLRREEALALNWGDVRSVEIDGREVIQIAVYKALTARDGLKQTKTGRSVRIAAMVEPFGQRLWSLRASPQERICRLGVNNINHRWMEMWEPCESPNARVRDRKKGIMLDAGIPYAPLGKMRATHETYMQQAGVLDSINAAAHGHSQQVSYRHYQHADGIEAARRAGEFLLVDGGKRAANE